MLTCLFMVSKVKSVGINNRPTPIYILFIGGIKQKKINHLEA